MAIFFEWDEEKTRINKRKHGVSFSAARAVFMDPFRFTTEDSVVDGEQRWRTIGLAGGIALLLVVHLEELAGDDVFIRMIHARRATPDERRGYEQNCANDV